MKTFLKYTLYLHFFIFLLLVSLPKTNLYYWGLEKLQVHKITLDTDKINDRLFSFQSDFIDGYYENIHMAKAEKLVLMSFVYRSEIVLENIQLNDIVRGFAPEFIKYFVIQHSLLSQPFTLNFEASLPKGRVFGTIDLLERKGEVFLELPQELVKEYSKSVEKFTKDGEYYKYELHY